MSRVRLRSEREEILDDSASEIALFEMRIWETKENSLDFCLPEVVKQKLHCVSPDDPCIPCDLFIVSD